jgi:hypothetical protein
MSQNQNASLIVAPSVTSFTQDQAHGTKTEAFVAIQPSQIATVLADHGLDLVHLRAGRARLQDRAAHQTTVARYRSRTPLSINGLFFDLVFKVPHLYGALQAFGGTYRQICTNGLVVGQKFFSGRIRHVGDAMSQLDALIPQMVAQHDQMTETIRAMMARNVTPQELATFAREVATLRLGSQIDTALVPEGARRLINVQYGDLIKVRRQEDAGADLWSVLNVVQENTMRYGLRYQTETPDARGELYPKVIRNMTARPITRTRQGETETVRSVDLNASIWDAAQALLDNEKAA